jgi:hypothetical protein
VEIGLLKGPKAKSVDGLAQVDQFPLRKKMDVVSSPQSLADRSGYHP